MHIKVFDNDGNFVTQWGKSGSGDGELDLSAGIAVDAQDNVYVADFSNIRIQKFDSSGNYLQQWATERPAGPASVIVDQHGNAYVDNFSTHNHYIQKFDSSGTLVNQWGTTGRGDGQFGAGNLTGPEDITLDAAGNIYVSDRLNHRIQKFDPDGNLLAIFGGTLGTEGHGLFASPLGLAVDGDGNIYVLDVSTHLLQKLDADGNFIAQWSTDGGDLDEAAIISLDWNNDIYVFAKTDATNAGGTPINAFVLKKFHQP